mgnify:CR=1 FL=1
MKKENKSFMEKNKKQIIAIALALVLLVGGSYAWLTLQVTGNKTNILRAGTLKLTLDDTTSNGILLEKAVPMSDTKGKTTTEYTFTLQNSGSIASDYKIYLDDVALSDDEVQLEDSKVKYQLIKNGEETIDLLSNLDNKTIDTGTIGTNKTNTYSLRVWIDSDAGNEIMGKILSKELRVEATQAKQTPTVAKSFADDSWDTIASVVKSGTYPYQVGDTKTVDMGSLGTHTVRVANTSECTNGETSETACGFVVEFADIITTQKMNSTNTNVGGWPASEMRTYVNTTVYNALPSDLQNVIAETSVVSGHGSTSGEANFTSSDKLYLLSTKEVWGKEGTSNTISHDTAEAETRQLDYYKNKGVTTSSYSGAIKQYNGTNTIWWLRSATSYYTTTFFTVNNYGDWHNSIATSTNGVAPAFRIA